MTDNLTSLSKLFSERIFRIPDYQRGYSWESRHLDDFWNDLRLLGADGEHYTGVLTLESVPNTDYQRWLDDLWIIESKSYSPFYIVDGQQRLTTCLILIEEIVRAADGKKLLYSTPNEIRRKYIRETHDGGISNSYLFGYVVDNPSCEFLKRNIFGHQSEVHSSDYASIYTKNLASAKAYFAMQLQGLDLESLEALFRKVTQRLIFNTHHISRGVDTFIAFETMNNRGKPLSVLELLKNRLIYLTTRDSGRGDEKERVRRLINESWKSVYHYLGKNPSRVLFDDPFLSRYSLIYFAPTFEKKDGDESVLDAVKLDRKFGDRNETRRFLLDRVFTARNLPGHPDPVPGSKTLELSDIRRFAQGLKEYAQLYFRLSNPQYHDGYSTDVRVALNRLWRLDKLADMALVSAVAEQTKERAYFLRFLNVLERWRFAQQLWRDDDGYMMTGNRLAVMLVRGDLSPRSLCEKLQQHTNDFVGKKSAYVPLWKRYTDRFYGWRPLNYFLYEYELHLQRRARGSEKITWSDFTAESGPDSKPTIEHIMPQRAEAAYWQNVLKGVSKRHRNALRNSLGNLVAVASGRNSAFGNRGFDEKKERVGETLGYRYGSYSEIELCEHDGWTPQAIADRGVRLLEFAEHRWQVKFGDRAAKLRLLELHSVPGIV